jgi:predicted permease
MGAGRGRLVRSLVTESILLALAGGILGLVLAFAGHDVLVRFAARFTTRAGEITLDRVILGFALATSVLTGLIFGGVPGLLAGPDPRATLLDSGGPSTPGGRNRRAQGLLVTVQVAVAFGVLAAAGLMLRSAWAVSRTGVGFATESMASMRVGLGGLRYRTRAQSDSFFTALQARMLAHPAVRDVARTMGTPFEGGHDHRDAFFIRGPHDREQNSGVGLWRGASADVFRVLQVPVLQGRGFLPGDTLGAPRVALVNRTFYRRYLEGVVPLGSELVRCNSPDDCDAPMTVVGVMADARYDGPDQAVLPEVYQPAAQLDWGGETLLVRIAGDPRAIGPELTALVHDLDPDVPVSQFAPLEQLRRESTAPRRFLALILSMFAVVAVGLAVAGIFGVASLAASARLQELGIRRALGAAPGSLEGLVVREAFRVVIPGLLAGGIAALALDTFVARFVWGVAPHDPLTLMLTAALFLGAAVLASWLPARRASRVDVMTTLNAP